MGQIKVAVSPFYGGEDWTCDKTGITFKRSVNGLNVYSISEDADMTNIRKAVRLNSLMLMEGELPKEEVKTPVQEEPKEEAKEEPKEEDVKVEEPKAEEPVLEAKEEEAEKPKTRTRKTTKSTASKK